MHDQRTTEKNRRSAYAFYKHAERFVSLYIYGGELVAAKNKETTVYPDFEVIVRRGAEEICTIAFFEDDYGGVDVLVGLSDLEQRPFLETAFEYAARAVKNAVIVASAPAENPNELPF